MLRQMRFIKAAKGKKEIRPQAINIGQLEMATDEYKGGLAAKDCPLFTFFPSWLL